MKELSREDLLFLKSDDWREERVEDMQHDMRRDAFCWNF